GARNLRRDRLGIGGKPHAAHDLSVGERDGEELVLALGGDERDRGAAEPVSGSRRCGGGRNRERGDREADGSSRHARNTVRGVREVLEQGPPAAGRPYSSCVSAPRDLVVSLGRIVDAGWPARL